MTSKRGFEYDEDAVRDAEEGVLRQEIEEITEAAEDCVSVGGLAVELGVYRGAEIVKNFPPPPEPLEATATIEPLDKILASRRHTKMYLELKARDPAHKKSCSVCLRRVPLNQIIEDICFECISR